MRERERERERETETERDRERCKSRLLSNTVSNLCRRKSSVKKTFDASVNVAYRDVNMKDNETEEWYENPTDIALKPSKQWTNNEEMACYSNINSKPPASGKGDCCMH